MTNFPALFSLLHELCALRVRRLPRSKIPTLSEPGRGKFFSPFARAVVLGLLALLIAIPTPAPQSAAPRFYLGFDRNTFPGDAALPVLRKDFAFASYWLSPPPGEKVTTWKGKRELLLSHGFGFLVLYRGRESRVLKNEVAAKRIGFQDAKNAAAAAKSEGFAPGAIIFLDIEEGGRLPANYHAYLAVWSEELTRAGYHPGAYCSGMPVHEGPAVTITTADDIHNDAASRDISIWAYNDFCQPSPGCAFPRDPPPPSSSGISYAVVWQFAQSPRRKEFTARCRAKYAPDGNCYSPQDTTHKWFLDVNTATSPDPSGGAK